MTRAQEQVDSSPVKTIDLAAGRRAFIKSIGASAIGAAVFGAAEGNFSEANAQSVSDIAIANFALNFEYLGATYYLTALTGQGLSASDIGASPGYVSGGRQVNFQSPIVQSAALNFAVDERRHVETLRAALGAQAISRPNLDIGNAFTAAARAAGIINPSPASNSFFDPYGSDNNFLLGAYIFEDVCVTLLVGSAALLQSKAVLAIAAGFLGVEGYQAGIIRTLLFAQQNQTLVNYTGAISNFRSAIANSGNINADDYGVGTVASPHLVPVNSNATAYSRTPRQVLNIAYGNAGAGAGGFFPSGVNGTLKG